MVKEYKNKEIKTFIFFSFENIFEFKGYSF